MELVEMRPSYSQRFRDVYAIQQLSAQEREQYLKEQIMFEEEKAEVKKALED